LTLIVAKYSLAARGRERRKRLECSKKTILIIDDDASILSAFSRILQKNGYATDTAKTGNEALEKAAKRHYVAALIDVCLPDINGVTLTSELQQLNSKMVKIIITGFPLKAPKSEAETYLIKPVKPEKLLATLKEKLSFQTQTPL
jgi:DNA-binding NtrC family response regulator